MKALSEQIDAYCQAVAGGDYPAAYRGILSALTAFKTAWEHAHPQDSVGALYQGYLDMSFIAVAPASLAVQRLKISLVFLHAEARFLLRLTAGNRAIQAKTSAELRKKSLGAYELCALQPGVDAIISLTVPPPYAFDEPEVLTKTLTHAAERFLCDMETLLL